MRKDFFPEKKVLAYFGGNNEEYFKEAFPAFLKILSEAVEQEDLSNYVVVLQQHPVAKVKNIDGLLAQEWIKNHSENPWAPQMIISDKSSDDMQVLADGALYYQTSMGPQFVLAGLPVAQVGHETYEDVLVRGKLCSSVTSSADFVQSITAMEPKAVTEEQKIQIFKSMGMNENWFEVLKQVVKGR